MDPYNDEKYHLTSITLSTPPTIHDKRKRDSRDERAEVKKVRTGFKEVSNKQQVSHIKRAGNVYKDDWKSCKKIVVEANSYESSDRFCDQSLTDSLINAKIEVTQIEKNRMIAAKAKANPYELVLGSIFMNRAAVKMANLDSIFKLLKPKGDQKFYFADICAGPGGFSEYILWRLRHCQGYGITLKGNQDFKISSSRFQAHYGEDGTGDLSKIKNINAYSEFTSKHGIDLVMGDGGFSTIGDEQYQEEHLQNLILSQVLTMFKILKRRGNFIVKVFDLLTDFSVEIVYILYLHFQSISIVKPHSSRPANSERYIVCTGLLEQSPSDLIVFLTEVLEKMNSLKPPRKTALSAHNHHQPGFISKKEQVDLALLKVTHLLDMDAILKDEGFIDAISGSNMRLALNQKDALADILKCAEDDKVLDYDQKEIAKKCSEEWKIPV